MKQSDFDSFSQLISSVGDYYGKPVSDLSLSIWWNTLKSFDLIAVREALSAHVQHPDNGQFMPKAADVVRLLGGTTTDRAMLAWSKVDKAIRTIGTYRDVAFDDAIIHRVIAEMGGWIGFGTKTEDELPFVAKEFQTRYRSYVVSGVEEYPSVLTGIANMHNIRNGLKALPAVLFGDSEKAKQVTEKAKQHELKRAELSVMLRLA